MSAASTPTTAPAREPATEAVRGTPAPALAAYVERYVGYKMSGLAPGTHAGLASTSLTVILSFDEPLDLAAMPDPSQRPGRWWSTVAGLHRSPATIRHSGAQHGIQIELTPAATRQLFAMPAAALAHTVVGLDDLLGTRGDSLHARVASATTWAERFELLDAELIECVRRTDARTSVRPELARAWTELRHRGAGPGGPTSIEALASDLGWSRRHLTAQFRSEYGMNPSEVRRIARFERARTLLARRRPLTEVAADAGYSDQSHLTREWGEFTGMTPTRWVAAEEFLSVQDLDPSFG